MNADMPGQPGNLTGRQALLAQLWRENPITRQVLGICSALAVTNLLFNTLLMCLGLIWATAMSAATVSLMRNYIPKRVRMMVEVLIIAVYVIMVDIAMRAYFPDIHKVIGPYVGLIIPNCIIMGRLEVFASKNRPVAAICDGLGAALGYSVILMSIAVVREILGFGTVFRGSALAVTVIAQTPGAWWRPWTLMIMPPGAFFVLGIGVWAARWWDLRQEARANGKEAAK